MYQKQEVPTDVQYLRSAWPDMPKKSNQTEELSIYCYTNWYFHKASKVGITFEVTYIMIDMTQM